MSAALSPKTQAAYARLADWVARLARTKACPIIGINGSQGSGKSTLAADLCRRLADHQGLRAVAVSIDDFYLSHAARQTLARKVHPLLATRGVPGTHDMQLALRTIQELQSLQPEQVLRLPGFDKASDDVLPAAAWASHKGPVDVVLFEGWCVGLSAQSEQELVLPINRLEALEDADGAWRRYVNDCLAADYQRAFTLCEALVFLEVPGWAQVRQWRGQQEQETAARHHAGQHRLLDDAAMERFLLHYQRLTEHALKTLPGRADARLLLDAQHDVIRCELGASIAV